MLQAFFDTNAKVGQYILIWVAFAVLQGITLSTQIPLSADLIFIDSFVHAAIYGLIGILIWSAIKYGNFNSLAIYQQFINYLALAVLAILVSVGLGFGFEYLLGEKIFRVFENFISARIFITILVYIIVIQHFRLTLCVDNNIELDDLRAESVGPILVPMTEDTTLELSVEAEMLERIAVKSGQKIHVILVQDIVYLQADGDYVLIYTMTAKYLKEQTMKYFEEHLPANLFVRVHRSCIVNVESISRIELYEKQNQQLTLKNGHQVKVSQSGYKLLRSKLNL
jgi:hypothetical protein